MTSTPITSTRGSLARLVGAVPQHHQQRSSLDRALYIAHASAEVLHRPRPARWPGWNPGTSAARGSRTP